MAITFLFCILCARFFYVQVAWSGDLAGKAMDQWTREIPVIAERGKIVDRNGELLADNGTAYTVFARSNAVKDAEYTAKKLAETLSLDYDKIYDALTGKRASEITVAKRVSKNLPKRR